MKSLRSLFFAGAILALPAVDALALSTTPPLPLPLPLPLMPAPADTTDWVLAQDALGFSDGKIKFCTKLAGSAILGRRCVGEGAMTPREALAKIGPPGAELTGFAPVMSAYGDLRGVLLYYKRAEAPASHAP